jgi:outer membrane protein OmpA-like peptidoglycan-associated protein
MKCWKRFLPLLLGVGALALILSLVGIKGFVERDLKGKAAGYLTDASSTLKGVSVLKTANHDITLTGPASLEAEAKAAMAAHKGSTFGYNNVYYIPTAEAPTPATTVAPTTTAAPTTTVASTTTKAPATTVATTAAPTTVAPTTTAVPVTTAAAVCSATLDGVKFATSSADLLPESLPILDAAAANLAKAACKIEIQGHTDIRGTVESNLALSQARADSVRNYLITKGIAQERLTAVGYGSSQPKAAGNDEAAWSINRRIEFKIQGS